MKKYLQFGLVVGVVVLIVIFPKGVNIPPKENTAAVINSLGIASQSLTEVQRDAILKALDSSNTTKIAPASTDTKTKVIPQIEGTLSFIHTDTSFNAKDEKKSASVTKYYIETGTTKYELKEEDVSKIGGMDFLVKSTGLQKVKIINAVVGSDNMITSLKSITPINTRKSSGPTLKSLTATTDKKVAVILLNFSDDQSQPYTPAEAKRIVFTGDATQPDTVNGYFHEASYNKINLAGYNSPTGDVFGYYTVPSTSSPCSYWVWQQQAKNLATTDGYTSTNYDFTIFIFPHTNNSCGFIANSGGSVSNGYFANIHGNSGGDAIRHEVGHLLGIWTHSNSFDCLDSSGTRVAYSLSCLNVEYGDSLDMMGNTWAHRQINAIRKFDLGFFAPAEVKTATSSGTYFIFPLELSNNYVKALKIPAVYDTSNNLISSWFLEYRQPYGVFDNFSSSDSAVNGVLVRKQFASGPWQLANGLDNSYLIDTHPLTSTFDDSALSLGETFTNSYSGFSVKVVNHIPSISMSGGPMVPADQVLINPGTPCYLHTSGFSNYPSQITYSMGSISNSFPIVIPFTYTNNDSASCIPTILRPGYPSYSVPTVYIHLLPHPPYSFNSLFYSTTIQTVLPNQPINPGQTVNGTLTLDFLGVLPCNTPSNMNGFLEGLMYSRREGKDVILPDIPITIINWAGCTQWIQPL